MNQPIAVVGASGFIGSSIVQQIVDAGLSVRPISRQRGLLPKDAAIVSVDSYSRERLSVALEGSGVVIHAAGRAHVFRAAPDEEERMREANEATVTECVNAAADAGAASVIFLSSVSVYGPTGTFDENAEPRPAGSYATSKLAGERCALAVGQQRGLNVAILRLATVYGEHDRGNVLKLIRAIRRRHFVWIGDGSNLKTLIHRDDAAAAVLAVALDVRPGLSVYNVACPAVEMREVVAAIGQRLRVSVPRFRLPLRVPLHVSRMLGAGTLQRFLEKWGGDNVYSFEKIERDYGFSCRVSLDEGIRREVAWYLEAQRESSGVP